VDTKLPYLHFLAMRLYDYIQSTKYKHKRNIMINDNTYKYTSKEFLKALGLGELRRYGRVVHRALKLLEHLNYIEIIEKRSLGAKAGGQVTVYIIRLRE